MLNRIGQVFLSAVLLAGAAMGTAQAADKAINFGIMSTESSQNLKVCGSRFWMTCTRKPA